MNARNPIVAIVALAACVWAGADELSVLAAAACEPWPSADAVSAYASALRKAGRTAEAFDALRQGGNAAPWSERTRIWRECQAYAKEDRKPALVIEAAGEIWHIDPMADVPFFDAALGCWELDRRAEGWRWFWRGFVRAPSGVMQYRVPTAVDAAFAKAAIARSGDPDLVAARWIFLDAARKRGEAVPPWTGASGDGVARFIPADECLNPRAYGFAADLADAAGLPGATALRERGTAVQRYWFDWRECSGRFTELKLDALGPVADGWYVPEGYAAPQGDRDFVEVYELAFKAAAAGRALFGGADRTVLDLDLLRARMLAAKERDNSAAWHVRLAMEDLRKVLERSFASTAYAADRTGTMYCKIPAREYALQLAAATRRSLEAMLGPDHPDVALLPWPESPDRAVLILQGRFGADAPETIAARTALAWGLAGSRDYVRAAAEAQAAIASSKAGGAGPSAALADALDALGRARAGLGDAAGAAAALEESVKSRRAALGIDHARSLPTLSELGFVRDRAGDQADALAMWREAGSLCESLRALDRFELSGYHRDLGVIASRKGLPAEAVAEFRRARELLPATVQDPGLGFDLGDALADSGSYDSAIAEYLAALEPPDSWPREADAADRAQAQARIAVAAARGGMAARCDAAAEAALAPCQPSGTGPAAVTGRKAATCLALLGTARRLSGRPALAIDCYEQALAAAGTGGPDDGFTDRVRNDLGGALMAIGAFAEAEAVFSGLLARADRLGSRADRALVVNNLGAALEGRRDLAGAAARYREALALWEAEHGKTHPRVATALNNLGCALQASGDFAGASECHAKAFGIRMLSLGADHPDTARSLNNLGNAAFAAGRPDEAETRYRNAIAIFVRLPGSAADAAAALSNLGCLLLSLGRRDEATVTLARAWELSAGRYEDELPFLGDEERAAFARSLATQFELCFALVAADGGGSAAARRLAMDALLLSKAALLDARRATRTRVLASGDPALAAAYDAWSDARGALARARAVPGADPASLEERAARLERELAARAAYAVALPAAPRWTELRAALEPGDVVVEVVKFRDYASGWGAAARYGMLALGAGDDAPAFTAGGDAGELEGRRLAAWRDLMEGNVRISDVPRVERELHDAFWAPVASLSRGAKTLWFAPDGVYCVFNPATLADPAGPPGSRVGDAFSFRVIASSRDLVRVRSGGATSRGPIVVVANPDFDAKVVPADPQWRARPPVFGGKVDRLPGTAREASAIAAAAAAAGLDCVRLTDAAATEAAVRGIAAPRILHVATHGFSLPSAEPSTPAGQGLSVLGAGAPDPSIDPLSRSGLVLAGANFGPSRSGEDGVLTAREAETLRLDGTELVVLSACETGLGEIQAGEGALSLDRAFRAAGAGAVVKTLWQVDDAATAAFMEAFYTDLLGGMDRRQAFGRAVAFLRASKAWRAPAYWGAFVYVGN